MLRTSHSYGIWLGITSAGLGSNGFHRVVSFLKIPTISASSMALPTFDRTPVTSLQSFVRIPGDQGEVPALDLIRSSVWASSIDSIPSSQQKAHNGVATNVWFGLSGNHEMSVSDPVAISSDLVQNYNLLAKLEISSRPSTQPVLLP